MRAERSDCVLGGSGHAPGPRFGTTVAEQGPGVPDLWADGMGVIVRRTVFYPGQDDGGLQCPHCGRLEQRDGSYTGPVPSQWRRFHSAAKGWMDGGPAEATCAYCGLPVALNEWQWESEPWAVGALGFTFWNCPPLLPAFVAEVGGRLGHPVRLVSGKF
ncbi:hypothetical protein GA0070558_11465 [Micromonospora haikouensis]|uniref:Uncharacterized protein n=1 Tax=Micromonospora haikouensis TaxID=686309 RepID=A0A1C4WB12_9ACTN|nr:hypothetical protein GA0070558_11465 [Micromonospora haikouensis]